MSQNATEPGQTWWRDSRIWVLVAVMVAIFVFDVALQSVVILPFLCVPVLVAAGFATPMTTGVLAALVVAMAAVSGWSNHYFRDLNGWLWIIALVVVGWVAVGLAASRVRQVQRHDAAEAEARTARAVSEERFRLLAENASDVVYQTSVSGEIRWISPTVRETLGWEPADLVGVRASDLVHPSDIGDSDEPSRELQGGERREVVPARYRTKAGDFRWMSIRARPMFDDEGEPLGVVVGLRDITAEHDAQQELEKRALHDPLTGLRNRAWILDMLDTDLAAAERGDSRVGVLFIDLDHFKVVNDSLGHAAGDVLLTTIAHRISDTLRPGDRVGRFGGDEFIVVAPGIKDAHEVEVIAERIGATIAADLSVEGHHLVPSASIGIAISSETSTSATLLRDTDAALFRAKAAGRSRWQFFDDEMHAQALSRLTTEDELRHALANHEFVVHYQPIVMLADDTVIGHEALVRWNHPRRGLLAPIEFLPVAEDSGLIVELGDQVLEQVCQMLESRPDLAGPVSVNHSAVQIARPGWHDRFLAKLASHHIEPGRIVVEVTETAVLSVLDSTRKDLVHLRDLGVGIHIDDFGTGYSSIALLRDLPITGLKLDASLTHHLRDDRTATILSDGLAGLADGLELMSIAEGVEQPEEAATLRRQGWTHAQGHLYGKPVPEPIGPSAPRPEAG